MGAQVSHSHKKKPDLTFIWEIENASCLFLDGYLESPSFIACFLEKTRWKVIYKLLNIGHIDLAIKREDIGPNSIEIEYEISFLAADGTPLIAQTAIKEFKRSEEGCLRLFQHYNEVFSQRKEEFIPNDALTVRCRMWGTGTDVSKADACFARTRLGVDRRSFVWAIKEFSSLQPGQKSKPFLSQGSNGTPNLILTLFIREKNGKNYVNIDVDQNYATIDHMIRFKLSLLDSDGKVVLTKETVSYILINSSYPGFHMSPRCAQIFETDVLRDKFSLLPNDVLSLRCELQVNTKPVFSRIENYRYFNAKDLERMKTEMPEIQLCEAVETYISCCPFKKAFEHLFEDESFCDIGLRAGESTIPVHKTVLSAFSPVFKDIFTQNMGENASKIVDIPDLNADTLRRLVQYIYTDRVEKLNLEIVMDLFMAANKYQLLDLRDICTYFLKSELDSSNVCSILSLACIHEDRDLRKAVEDFISEHDKQVFTSDAWKKFKMENLPLALEITERIITLINKNN